jgi:hypothetical protein
MFLDKDMMQIKLEIAGVTYYYSDAARLQAALAQGVGSFAMIRNANYIVQHGRFVKNRSSGDEIPNMILAAGRDKINELFDFMEGK